MTSGTGFLRMAWPTARGAVPARPATSRRWPWTVGDLPDLPVDCRVMFSRRKRPHIEGGRVNGRPAGTVGSGGGPDREGGFSRTSPGRPWSPTTGHARTRARDVPIRSALPSHHRSGKDSIEQAIISSLTQEGRPAWTLGSRNLFSPKTSTPLSSGSG